MTLTVGSLFSGIGGIDLGLERAGMIVRWQCEIDPFCQSVLRRHWPGVRLYDDIHEIDARAERVDVLAGGFPCQPVSLAGRRLGQDDPRWLWPQFARVIGDLRPRYVLVENVPGLASKGLRDVVTDLAAHRYDAEWDVVPAAAVGAPHLRERLFVVAYPDRERSPQCRISEGERERRLLDIARSRGGGTRPSRAGDSQSNPHGMADPDCEGFANAEGGTGQTEPPGRKIFVAGDARLRPHEWAPEPAVGRVADGIPGTLDRLRALGNAVVPQVAEHVGRLILEADRHA